jgi:hypothetical protein
MESTFAVWDAVVCQDYEGLVKAIKWNRYWWVRVCTKVLENGVQETEERLLADVVDATMPQGAGCGGYILAVAKDPKDRIRLKLRRP